jgi:hypothetical protein
MIYNTIDTKLDKMSSEEIATPSEATMAAADHDTRAMGAGTEAEAVVGTEAEAEAEAEAVIDYTIGPEELKTIEMFTGYLAKWNADDPSGEESMAKLYNNTLVGDASLRLLAWCLLASNDGVRIDTQKDNTQTPVLCTLGRLTGYIDAARKLLRIENIPFVDEHHFVRAPQRDRFNPRMHLSYAERSMPIGKASSWTLYKAFYEQINGAVDRAYSHIRGGRGLPILAKTSTSTSKRGKDPEDAFADESKRPTFRTPNDALWGKFASLDICEVIDLIKDSFNSILNNPPENLAHAYRAQGKLRLANREAALAKRETEYQAYLEKKKSEGVSAPQIERKPNLQNSRVRLTKPAASAASGEKVYDKAKPYGKPHGKPYGKPYEKPHGKPYTKETKETKETKADAE